MTLRKLFRRFPRFLHSLGLFDFACNGGSLFGPANSHVATRPWHNGADLASIPDTRVKRLGHDAAS